MDQFVIENIFQINAALGILYVGLPKFRFRENLYDIIVERINFHEYLKMPFNDVAKDLLHDADFTDNHKCIRSIIALLPEAYRGNLKGNKNIDTLFPEEEQPPRPLSGLYRWFANDRDKYTVGLCTIFVSIVALWILCFFSLPASKISLLGRIFMGIFIFGAFLGQIVFGANVYFGRRMAQQVKKDLNNSLEIATEKIRKVQAKLDTRTPPTLPPIIADDDLPF